MNKLISEDNGQDEFETGELESDQKLEISKQLECMMMIIPMSWTKMKKYSTASSSTTII